MARRNFATVDALLALACVVIFAGGVLAQNAGPGPGAPPRDEPPVEKMAADLGISADRVREGFRKIGPPSRSEQRRPNEALMERNTQALAVAMNVSPDKLASVLEKYRPARLQRGADVNGNTGDRS